MKLWAVGLKIIQCPRASNTIKYALKSVHTHKMRNKPPEHHLGVDCALYAWRSNLEVASRLYSIELFTLNLVVHFDLVSWSISLSIEMWSDQKKTFIKMDEPAHQIWNTNQTESTHIELMQFLATSRLILSMSWKRSLWHTVCKTVLSKIKLLINWWVNGH